MKIKPMKAIRKMVQSKIKPADKAPSAITNKTAAKSTLNQELPKPEATRNARTVQFKTSPGTAPALPADRPWSHRPVLDNELRRLDPTERDAFMASISNIEKMVPGLAAQVFADPAVKTLRQGLARLVDLAPRKPVDIVALGIGKRVHDPITAETEALSASLSPVVTVEADEPARGFVAVEEKHLSIALIGAHKKANANKLIAAIEKEGTLVFVPVSKDDLAKPGYRQGVELAGRVLREQPQFFESLGQGSGPVTQGELFDAVTGGSD